MNTKITPFAIVSESRLKDAKEIFEKDVREKGLKVYVSRNEKDQKEIKK